MTIQARETSQRGIEMESRRIMNETDEERGVLGRGRKSKAGRQKDRKREQEAAEFFSFFSLGICGTAAWRQRLVYSVGRHFLRTFIPHSAP